MRSATAIAAFAGLANASIIYSAPPAEYPVPEVSASAEYPGPDVTEYSTQLVTITSCAPDVPCPAQSTVVSESLIPLTTSTVYSTDIQTITKCPEDVIDCPGREQTEYVTETIAVSTTVCPVSEATPVPSGEGEVPYPPPSESKPVVPSAPASEVPEASKPVYPPPVESSPAKPSTATGNKPEHPPATSAYPVPPVPSKPTEGEELCPTESVKTIIATKEVVITTSSVVTTYETVTAEVPCPEATQPAPSVVVPPVPGNATTPAVPSGTLPVEAGAAAISGSVFVTVFGALAAIAFL